MRTKIKVYRNQGFIDWVNNNYPDESDRATAFEAFNQCVNYLMSKDIKSAYLLLGKEKK